LIFAGKQLEDVALCLTTTSRRSPLSTLYCAFVVDFKSQEGNVWFL
jgi:hypothetical protein